MLPSPLASQRSFPIWNDLSDDDSPIDDCDFETSLLPPFPIGVHVSSSSPSPSLRPFRTHGDDRGCGHDCDYDCDCDCEEEYEVVCPECGDSIYLNYDMLEEGEMTCPNCGEHLEFDLDAMDDDCHCEGGHCDCGCED